jgi:hypothetical protein
MTITNRNVYGNVNRLFSGAFKTERLEQFLEATRT